MLRNRLPSLLLTFLHSFRLLPSIFLYSLRRLFLALLPQMAEGNGPVNALAQALKAALVPEHPALQRVRLTDYKVDLLGADTRIRGNGVDEADTGQMLSQTRHTRLSHCRMRERACCALLISIF